MKIFLVLNLCFLSLFNTYCQVQNPSTIEELFRKEFSVDKENNVELSIVTLPEILPDWFFNPPQRNQYELFVIGISDPWIEKEKGIQQAKLRAFCLASLMINVTSKGISDVYYKNDQSYKLELITYFDSQPDISLEGKVVDSAITKYNEYIFLYSFRFGKTQAKNNTKIEYYKSAINQDAIYGKHERFEFVGNVENSSIRYKYAAFNNDFEIESTINSDTINIKPTIYQYSGVNKLSKIDSIDIISLFKKGLWQGYFKSFIDNLELIASEMNARQKSVSDFKKNSNDKNKFDQLSRGIYSTSFSFDITSIAMTKKELVIHLKTYKKQ